MARQLVEKGVRFVQLYTPSQSWDSHTNLETGHRKNAKETDQPIAALLKDLKQRGLLDTTLVVWMGEFGRTPDCPADLRKTAGRDHNTRAMTVWFAGGGAKAGTLTGVTDDLGHKAVQDIYRMRDVHATVLHLMGLEDMRLTYYSGGRNMRLTDTGGKIIRVSIRPDDRFESRSSRMGAVPGWRTSVLEGVAAAFTTFRTAAGAFKIHPILPALRRTSDLARLSTLGCTSRELYPPDHPGTEMPTAAKDHSTDLHFPAFVKTLQKLTFSYHFLDRTCFHDSGLETIQSSPDLRELSIRQTGIKDACSHLSRTWSRPPPLLLSTMQAWNNPAGMANLRFISRRHARHRAPALPRSSAGESGRHRSSMALPLQTGARLNRRS